MLVIWVPLHCCAEHGSPASRVWTQNDDIHITTSSHIWSLPTRSMESTAHKYLDFSLDLVSPSDCFALYGEARVYFPPAAIILQQRVSHSGCQVWQCRATISLPGLHARMRLSFALWLIDWRKALFSITTWLPTYLLHNCVLLLFRFCLMLGNSTKRLCKLL